MAVRGGDSGGHGLDRAVLYSTFKRESAERAGDSRTFFVETTDLLQTALDGENT